MIELLENEQLEDLQLNNLFLIQKKKGFKFGIDAVLLSDIIKLKENDIYIDFCAGNGIIPILMSEKSNCKKIFGVEIQKESFDMACKSIIYNNLSGRIKMLNADVRNLEIFKQNNIEKNSVDVISVNPPYFKVGNGLLNDINDKIISRHEVYLNLADLFKSVNFLLRYNGIMYMIHRPDRLVDIFYFARINKIEPKWIRFVQPKLHSAPNLVLIKFIKNAGSELKYEKNLIVYNDDNTYTDEIIEIYNKHRKVE